MCSPLNLSSKMVTLSGNMQGKKEILQEYINMFTKVCMVVWGVNYGLKCWIFIKGLRAYCMFSEKLGLEGVDNMNKFLNKPRPYIN